MTALIGSSTPLNLAVSKTGGRNQGGEPADGEGSFLSVVGKLDDKKDPRQSRDNPAETTAEEQIVDGGASDRGVSASNSGQNKDADMAVSFDANIRVRDGDTNRSAGAGAQDVRFAESQTRNLADILDSLNLSLGSNDDVLPPAQAAPEGSQGVKADETPARSVDIVIANLVSSGVSLATLVQVARVSSADHPGQRFVTVDPNASNSAVADDGAGAETHRGEADDLFRFGRSKDDAGSVERAARLSATDPEAGKAAPLLPEAERPAPTPAPAEPAKATAPILEARTAVERSLDLPGSGRLQAELSILESRKYLGVATGQTAVAAVIHAVTENPEWNAMLRETAATSATLLNAAKNGSNSLKIQLSPAELGVVTATFRLNGGQLSVELKVETIEAYRQLSDDNGDIVKALKGHGYEIDHVTVQHVSNDRANVAPGQNQLGASANGGSTQGALPDGRPGGQQPDRGGGFPGRQSGGGDGPAAAAGTSDGGHRADGHRGDGRRPGSVYL